MVRTERACSMAPINCSGRKRVIGKLAQFAVASAGAAALSSDVLSPALFQFAEGAPVDCEWVTAFGRASFAATLDSSPTESSRYGRDATITRIIRRKSQ